MLWSVLYWELVKSIFGQSRQKVSPVEKERDQLLEKDFLFRGSSPSLNKA